jgi:hypothetical protein
MTIKERDTRISRKAIPPSLEDNGSGGRLGCLARNSTEPEEWRLQYLAFNFIPSFQRRP